MYRSILAATALIATSSATSTPVPAYPFPQNIHFEGAIRPSNMTDSMLNEDVQRFYLGWKKEFIHPTVSVQGGYIVATGGGTGAEDDAITVSEGHGYGMVITALMAGFDPEAKTIFDGFYKVFRAWPSDMDPDLMTWQIEGELGKSENPKLASSASDGDMDIAYGLILADRQWGSNGEINYLAEARKVIDAIGRKDIHPELFRTTLGDWVEPGNEYRVGTRSSDWMVSHFRLFGAISGNEAFWNNVTDTCYSILKQVQNKTTGLIPDFIDSVPAEVAKPNYLETERDGHFSSNACRTPWRIAMDFLHYGTQESRESLKPLLTWIEEKTGGDLAKMDNGYSLEGIADKKHDRWGTWGAYSAPMMVAAATESRFQKMVDSGWKHNSQFDKESMYYSTSLQLLALLAISGNWWNPDGK